MRPAKTLAQHVGAGTFRPARHGRLLAGADLPVTPHVASPICRRIWNRLRSLQIEYRQASGADLLHEIAHEFSRAANEYLEAAARGHGDPTKDIAGIGAILKINRRAREDHEAEQAGSNRA